MRYDINKSGKTDITKTSKHNTVKNNFQVWTAVLTFWNFRRFFETPKNPLAMGLVLIGTSTVRHSVPRKCCKDKDV